MNDPITYPPEVYDDGMGSPASSQSDPPMRIPVEETSSSRRGFRLNRSQSRLFRKSDKGRESSAPTQSNSTSHSSRRSVSALLVLTTERLNNATARASDLETQQDELVKRFGILLKEKAALERELDQTRENLHLHKAQLDVARREIDRADELVQEIDRRRSKAESESAKLRGQVRNLEAEKMVKKGWDEGWDLGFKEGLERAQTERSMFSRFSLRRRRQRSRDERSNYTDDYTDDGRDDETTNPEQSVASSSSRPRSSSTRSRRSNYTPDAAELVPPLPIPTITTPVPLDIPSTQPQQPQRPPSASQQRSRARATSVSSQYNVPRPNENRSETPRRPQSRTARRNTAPSDVRANPPTADRAPSSGPEIIQPIPVYTTPPSPSATSHRSRSTVPPPDNYIPFQDANEFISLPPPHEMSIPVPASGPVVIPSRRDQPATAAAAGSSRGLTGFLGTPRAMSDVSRGSTRISQFDIVSPPRSSGPLGLRVVNADRPNRGNGNTSRNEKGISGNTPNTPSAASSTRVEQWRNEVAGDVDRPDRQPTPAAPREISTSSPGPPSVTSPPRGSFRVRTPRVSIGPRRPRDIVLPAPLAPPPQQRDVPPNVQRPEQVPSRSYTPIRSPIPTRGPPPSQSPYQQGAGSAQRPGPPPIPSDSPENNRSQTPRSLGAWLRNRFQRAHSTPPNIDIEPPSHSASSAGSNSNALDPVLLTPDDANRPIPLPNDIVSEATRGITPWSSSTPVPQSPITIRLPDEDLPLGFVPMSPVQPLQETRTQSSQSPSRHIISPPNSRPGSPGSFSTVQPLVSSLSPPTRPATASGLTRPALSTVPDGARGGGATRAFSGPPVDRVAEMTSPRTRTMSLEGRGGWASPTNSFMRPLESIFGDED
ncbi:hypothetical protein VNI00_012465 [Paramarasmius palmivorus]|uniref:Uncharacterized protein n=1 Tax=Paramarasmius palmivorus TaxID=297713 RepID=A0AAW0C4A1_9AGAR